MKKLLFFFFLKTYIHFELTFLVTVQINQDFHHSGFILPVPLPLFYKVIKYLNTLIIKLFTLFYMVNHIVLSKAGYPGDKNTLSRGRQHVVINRIKSLNLACTVGVPQ